VNSFPSSVFSSEANGETEKKTLFCCGRFHSLLVAFRNTKTHREDETEQSRSRTKQALEALSIKKIKTKPD